MFNKVCQVCGKGYVTESRVSRGCCDEHEAQARQLPKVETTCAHCGKKIMRTVAATKRRCYCSQACRWAASTRPKPTKECPVCGKIYHHDPGSKRLYCSPKCAGQAMREQREKHKELRALIEAPPLPASKLEPSTIETWDVCVGY